MFIQYVCQQASLNWGKKDEPVYVTEESGVVGLNFHQSKEVLIHDTTNGIGSHYDVRITPLRELLDYCPIGWKFPSSLAFEEEIILSLRDSRRRFFSFSLFVKLLSFFYRQSCRVMRFHADFIDCYLEKKKTAACLTILLVYLEKKVLESQ